MCVGCIYFHNFREFRPIYVYKDQNAKRWSRKLIYEKRFMTLFSKLFLIGGFKIEILL